MLDHRDFLLELYCLVDDALVHVMPAKGLRQRGPAPTLSDAEVITIELAGEAWGLDQDKSLFGFFRQYHPAEFPALARLDRTTFVRQAANLWAVKQRLRQVLVEHLPVDLRDWSLFDSFPVYVCQFARAKRCRLFAGLATYGYDHLQRHIFFGFKIHLRDGIGGPILDFTVAPANVADADSVPELAPAQGGIGLGDRAYWDPLMQEDLRREKNFVLIAPFRWRSHDRWPALSQVISRLRQGIETVISQLVERFHAKWTWARDRWHLCHRIIRKILAHTACLVLNVRHGNPPLQLDLLLG
jgi:hypothetical protein